MSKGAESVWSESPNGLDKEDAAIAIETEFMADAPNPRVR